MNKEEKMKANEASITSPLVPKKRKKKKWPVVIVTLLVIGGSLYVFRTPLINGLRNVPVIGNLIPINEVDGENDNLSLDELKVKLNSEQRENERLSAELEALKSTNAALLDKNESLTQYEEMYAEFMNQKATWDEAVARTNPDLFIEQFETFYPEVAERLYQVLKGEQVLSDKQKKLSTTIGQMDEDQAAAALELLISTDPELIQSIFEGMNTDRKALVLSAMSSKGAAQVIKLISPDE